MEALAKTLTALGKVDANESDSQQHSVLQKLTLNRCDLGCERADEIASETGKFAYLSPEARNNILRNSLRSVEALSAMLEDGDGQACRLQVLQLNKARIGNKACVRIAQAMQINRNLKELSLGCVASYASPAFLPRPALCFACSISCCLPLGVLTGKMR